MPTIPRISYRKLVMKPLWNLILLTVGAAFIAFGVQAVAAHHGFLSGGVLGLGILIWYVTDTLNAPTWSLLINIPLFLFGWFGISRRFLLYSIYGTLAVFLWGITLDHFNPPLSEPLYAAIISGVMVGAGAGIMLRSYGSGGGLDIVGVFLNQKFNLAIGNFAFMFNAVLFLFSLATISLDMVLLSFIMVFISSNITDYVLRAFSQRKIVLIVTSKGQEICNQIINNGGRATIMPAYGGYSHEAREVVLTIITNFTLRALEDIVFTEDPDALFAVENTFYVASPQYPRDSR